jgi:heme oxygenase
MCLSSINHEAIAYLTISNNNDAETLQKDLDKLGHWENEWCMKFHPDKCTVLRVTNKKKII